MEYQHNAPTVDHTVNRQPNMGRSRQHHTANGDLRGNQRHQTQDGRFPRNLDRSRRGFRRRRVSDCHVFCGHLDVEGQQSAGKHHRDRGAKRQIGHDDKPEYPHRGAVDADTRVLLTMTTLHEQEHQDLLRCPASSTHDSGTTDGASSKGQICCVPKDGIQSLHKKEVQREFEGAPENGHTADTPRAR